MRIALIGLSHPFRGGIAHYTTALYQALIKKHQSFLFGFKRQYPELLFPGKTQKDTSACPFQADHYNACLDSINPWSWWKTYQDIQAYKPDIVLLTWWHPFFAPCYALLTGLLSQKAQIPCYFLCHNVLPHEHSLVDKLLTRLAFANSAGFIVHAQQQAEQLKSISSRPILVNPHPNYDCFINPQDFSREEARKHLQVQDKKVLLFFGLIRAYKGLQYLLEAMLQLDQDYHLLLVGEFYQSKTHYQPAIDQLIQRDQLTLVDRYISNEEVGLYFIAADILVAPYTDATQSGVIQIAYSFNKPVIATRVGGLPEIIADGETGYLIAPQDSPALTHAIKQFFSVAERTAFNKAIQQRQYLFSWDHMVNTIEQLRSESRIS